MFSGQRHLLLLLHVDYIHKHFCLRGAFEANRKNLQPTHILKCAVDLRLVNQGRSSVGTWTCQPAGRRRGRQGAVRVRGRGRGDSKLGIKFGGSSLICLCESGATSPHLFEATLWRHKSNGNTQIWKTEEIRLAWWMGSAVVMKRHQGAGIPIREDPPINLWKQETETNKHWNSINWTYFILTWSLDRQVLRTPKDTTIYWAALIMQDEVIKLMSWGCGLFLLSCIPGKTPQPA